MRIYYGTYRRTPEGLWLYPWGEPVLGAQDLTLATLMQLGVSEPAIPVHARFLTVEELVRVLEAEPMVSHAAEAARAILAATPPSNVVVGLQAPELNVRAMLTVPAIAAQADVSPETIAAYRYRGHLPDPQAIVGRTPLWARPIIRRWLTTRPGTGWRTDIYGRRDEHEVGHLRRGPLAEEHAVDAS